MFMEKLRIDQSVMKRLIELREKQGEAELMLRICVEGGGCSGFQYELSLDAARCDDDLVFGDCVVTDSVSLPYLLGSHVRFEQGLMGSEFKIDNPNAVQGCGCGSSFSV